VPSDSSPFGGSGCCDNPIAIFYGSGNLTNAPLVPDELRWSVKTLGAQVESGDVCLLDVVAAIKTAMPLEWLAEHDLDGDCTSIVFSFSNSQILDAYAAALRAWGADDIIMPPVIDDEIFSRGIIPVESVSATTFDIPKTINQSNGRGFHFHGDDLRVRFPIGPISCFTQALVGPLLSLKFAHFSFKDIGGNSAWSVGLIPEAQCNDANVLWGTRGSIGRHYSGSGSCLPQVRTNQGDVLTSCVDAVQRVWFLCINGKIVAREPVPASHFPVRLGLCGHSGSSFEVIPQAAVPLEVAKQCKLASAAGSSGPVIWQVTLAHQPTWLLFSIHFQWLRDDGSWASYDAIHIPALEKTYRYFLSKPHRPSRYFIELSIEDCSIRYQFDFKEPMDASHVDPGAPRNGSVCSVVGSQMNLRTLKTREIRRCISANASASALSRLELHASDDALRSELVIEAMQVLSRELEVCVMSVPPPSLGITPDISIHSLSYLQSSLLSASFQTSKSSEYHGWTKLASEVPLLLDSKTKLSLFRNASGTCAQDLENMKKDRVNGVDRNCILDWAAAIAFAQRKQGRRNPLAIQVNLSSLLPHRPLTFCCI
jgi:hypothetical protein